MIRKPNRRDVLKSTATLAAAGCFGAAPADAAPSPGEIDAALRAAVQAGDVPGIVALAATDNGLVYEGVFGRRRLPGGPTMTRNTVFRIASMVKAITSVATLQLVEQEKLALDAPVPPIESQMRLVLIQDSGWIGGQHPMGRAYSFDLRERVVAAVAAGESCRAVAVAATFKVSVASARRHRHHRQSRQSLGVEAIEHLRFIQRRGIPNRFKSKRSRSSARGIVRCRLVSIWKR